MCGKAVKIECFSGYDVKDIEDVSRGKYHERHLPRGQMPKL